MTKEASVTAKTEWIICWFVEGLGQGWVSEVASGLMPWSSDVSQAYRYASEADADRQIIECYLQSDSDPESMWVELLDKVRL